MSLLERDHQELKERMRHLALAGVLCCVIGIVAFEEPGLAVLLLCTGAGLLAYYFAKVNGASRAIEQAKADWKAKRTNQWAAHERRLSAWEQAIDHHNVQEQHRYENEPVWYPVEPQRPPRRIDVYGGTSDGWACLLTTAGATMIASGSRIVLLDLTGDDVGADLVRLTSHQGYQCTTSRLHCAGSGPDVLGGLDHHDVVDALALSVREATGTVDDHSGESLALDSEVFDLAIACLDPPYSLARVVAALTFLGRPQDAEAAAQLGDHELRELSVRIDTVASDTELRRRLSVIVARLRPLRDVGVDDAQRRLVEQSGSTYVQHIVLEHGTNAQIAAMRRVLFNALMLELRSVPRDDCVVIVAGGDQLSHLSLEQMSNTAARSGARLVMMFKHLRGSVMRILGGDRSATIFMRLGNAEEAAAAAEFVGHEHRLVLSQLTHTFGETFTDSRGVTETEQHGTGHSWGESRGSSDTYGDGWLPNLSFNRSYSDTTSTSRSHAWAQTSSIANAISEQAGETYARSYDFTVEPTRFQSLPLTAFVAVSRTGHDNLIVAGDCNPGIAALGRVSPTPYRESPVR